ncbi:MAG: cytochrome b/b6 domain-containing protein [Acidobacteriota bacterium]
MTRVLLYQRFERFWHWAQMLLILGLLFTGFDVHGSYHLLGYARAVDFHNAFALALIVLIVFAVFWHFTTGEWKQYIPTRKFLKEMAGFYLTGIFKGAPHPVKKSRTAKLNPLQRLAYLGFKLLIIPVQVTSGLVYFFYPNLNAHGWPPWTLRAAADVHVLGGFFLLAFLIGHVYLTTTGFTPLTNLKAMVFGWELMEEE